MPNDLPTRDQVRGALLMNGGTDRFIHGQALLQPYADGRLMTRQEFIDSLDTEYVRVAKMGEEGLEMHRMEVYVVDSGTYLPDTAREQR